MLLMYVPSYFRRTKYAGEFNEAGWNGLEFAGASNCWARNMVSTEIWWVSAFIPFISFSDLPWMAPLADCDDCDYANHVS